jgi:hypothetical protein
VFEQRAKKILIIQNQIARILIGQQADQAIGAARPLCQRAGYKIDILSSELDTAVWEYDLHSDF